VLELHAIVTQFLNGATLVSVLVLISMGLAIIFGVMGVINLAHGEFFILGSYTVIAADVLGLNAWVGIALAPLVVGMFGGVIERGLIRFLYARPLETLLATWGLSIVIRQLIRLVFGVSYRASPHPLLGDITAFGFSYPAYRILLIAVCAVVTLGAFYVFYRTDYGLKIRAITQDVEMAAALAINTSRMYLYTFVLGSALAGFAGALMTPEITVSPETGLSFLARAFFVVILGGIGHLAGVLGGAAVVGELETLLSYLISATTAQALVLVVAIIIIRFRPQGLFRG
jgi:branched-chain amino acid transport system permease protein/urea transport system permease protein